MINIQFIVLLYSINIQFRIFEDFNIFFGQWRTEQFLNLRWTLESYVFLKIFQAIWQGQMFLRWNNAKKSNYWTTINFNVFKNVINQTNIVHLANRISIAQVSRIQTNLSIIRWRSFVYMFENIAIYTPTLTLQMYRNMAMEIGVVFYVDGAKCL